MSASSPARLPAHTEILAMFENPAQLWRQVLDSLTESARNSFAVFSILGGPVRLETFELAGVAAYPDLARDFFSPLRELDDTFVSISRSLSETSTVDFLNPSVQDFAQSWLEENPERLRASISAPVAFRQPQRVYALARSRSTAVGLDFRRINGWVKRNCDHLIAAMARTSTEMLFGSERVILSRIREAVNVGIHFGASVAMDPSLRDLMDRAVDDLERYPDADGVLALLGDEPARRVFETVRDDWSHANLNNYMLRNARDDDHFIYLSELDPGEVDRETLRQSFQDFARRQADNMTDSENPGALNDEKESLLSISRDLDVDISDIEQEYDLYIDNIPIDVDDYSEGGQDVPSQDPPSSVSTTIDAMFANLAKSRDRYTT